MDFECRKGCAACCIVISIASTIPGHPSGKPAGVRCANLSQEDVCNIHGLPSFPAVCRNLTPQKEMCGNTREDAFVYLALLEDLTKP